jgi:hypothetical protein
MFRSNSFIRLESLEDLVEEKLLGQSAFDKRSFVDHGLWHCEHLIFLRQLRELRGFNAVGMDQIVFHGEALRQADRLRTVRSRWCHENLEVNWGCDLRELLLGLRLQAGFPPGNGENSVEQV